MEGEERPRFVRPWEEPGPDDEPEPASAAAGDEEPEAEPVDDWALEVPGPFFQDDYLSATTRDYQGLAQDVARANEEAFERQAVAATIPGVGAGLIGFEDVTGRRGVTEEEVEEEEQRRTSDLTLRVGSALVLVSIFLTVLFLGGVWFTAFIALIMVMGVGEFYATLRTRGYSPAALFGLLGVLGAAVGGDLAGPLAIGGAVAVTTVVVALFYSVAVRRRPLENATVTVLGAAWMSLLAFAILIGRSENAEALVFALVVVTGLFDVASFFVGRAFGRRLLAPRVSPRKTLEGLAGGVVMALLSAAVLSTIPFFAPIDLVGALALGALVAVFAPLGDAAESVVKRALGVKDMGSILPGHGGMLDRVDAFLFVVPLAYLLYDRLGYL